MTLNRIFYVFKPILPRRLQIALRRQIAFIKRRKYAHIWPIDPGAGNPPEGWNGWPEGKKFALILTHDVDTQKGHDRCYKLMDLEEELGFRSSFNFVPERYNVSMRLLEDLKRRGFEVGVHGLKHDGKLYASRDNFDERAVKINRYLKQWNVKGFRSPAMHHNLEWLQELNILYDASTFDVDPFEPQSDGVRTIFPFWVSKDNSRTGFVELPYTLAQDFSLFVILKEKTITLWTKKLGWIVENGGMALLNTHPDYMNFGDSNRSGEEFAVEMYIDFLQYVKNKYNNKYFDVLPRDVSKYWISNMKL